jgi:hypothetical protein
MKHTLRLLTALLLAPLAADQTAKPTQANTAGTFLSERVESGVDYPESIAASDLRTLSQVVQKLVISSDMPAARALFSF